MLWKRVARLGLLVHGERQAGIGRARDGVFQLHRDLALEAGHLAQAEQRREGIEQPAHAGRDRGIEMSVHHGSQGRELGRREGTHRGGVDDDGLVAEDLEEQGQGAAAGLAHGLLVARQEERPQVPDPPAAFIGDVQELATPYGPVLAHAAAIPRDAEHGWAQAILGHAGQDVRVVVLHPHDREVQGAGRGVARVQVASHPRRREFVEALERGDDRTEGRTRALGFQIADVLAEEDLRADRRGDGVLLLRAHGQHGRKLARHRDGQGREATRAPEHELAAGNLAHDGIVHVAQDGPVVH